MADWTETCRPTTLSEVRGNDSARDAFEEWAETWVEHGEAVVLHSSPGVGKTSAAHALANDLGWPVLEMNASDARTADEIERFAGRAASPSRCWSAVPISRSTSTPSSPGRWSTTSRSSTSSTARREPNSGTCWGIPTTAWQWSRRPTCPWRWPTSCSRTRRRRALNPRRWRRNWSGGPTRRPPRPLAGRRDRRAKPLTRWLCTVHP